MEKNLYRSWVGPIGGVCSGIAEYMDVEPLIVQVIFVLLFWTPVPIIWIYIFLWLFLKKEPI